MTTPDFRALCAEFVAQVEHLTRTPNPPDMGGWLLLSVDVEDLVALTDRARAALVQEPQVATDEQMATHEIGPEWKPCHKLPITVHVRAQRPGEAHVSTREGITPVRPDDLIMRGVEGEEYPIGRKLFNRTYRMGAALAQEQQGPTVMQIIALADEIEAAGLGQVDLVRAVLARWGGAAPLPVPVSERLPGSADCDEEGRCWFYSGDWMMKQCRYRGAYDTHWLPANALPLPEVEG